MKIINNTEEVRLSSTLCQSRHPYDEQAKTIFRMNGQKSASVLDQDLRVLIKIATEWIEINFERASMKRKEDSNSDLRLTVKNFEASEVGEKRHSSS
jgi:hypothetical protein